jgi:IS1 family transposase
MGNKRSRRWVWRAIDPESKLLLAIETGVRTLEMAQRHVRMLKEALMFWVPLWAQPWWRQEHQKVLCGKCQRRSRFSMRCLPGVNAQEGPPYGGSRG